VKQEREMRETRGVAEAVRCVNVQEVAQDEAFDDLNCEYGKGGGSGDIMGMGQNQTNVRAADYCTHRTHLEAHHQAQRRQQVETRWRVSELFLQQERRKSRAARARKKRKQQDNGDCQHTQESAS